MENQYSSLKEKLMRMQGLMHRYRHAFGPGQGRPGADPHRGQGRVLALLRMQPEITQRELSYLLDMRAQSLGELLAKLEKSGYITRTPSEDDRRVMNIRLTPEGQAAADAAANAQQDSDGWFDFLSDEEKQQLENILDKMIAAMEGKLAESGWDEKDMPMRDGRCRPDRMKAMRGMYPGGHPGWPMGFDGPGRGHGPHKGWGPRPEEPWDDRFGGEGPEAPENDE